MFCEDCGEDLSQVESTHPGVHRPSVPAEPGITLYIQEGEQAISLRLQARSVLGRADADRARQPDIDLSPFAAYEMGVSGLHAAVQHTTDGVQIVDLGSTNGTYVNGRRLIPSQYYVLRDGDEIRFGRLTTYIQIVGIG
jgi:pSer/pThr/pTyr-binding forkhead associated (FHA) protein